MEGGRISWVEQQTSLLLVLITDWLLITSLHTNMVPKTTCRPSKKLSPMRMTVAPPVVQPSLGLMALMQGVAASETQEAQRD